MAAVSTPTIICSSSSSRLSSSKSKAHNTKKLSFDPKKRLYEVGIGLLASSIIALTPLEAADATRIQYYATTAEPLCEFSFVRSGLGYCDLAPGSAVEAPYGWQWVRLGPGLDKSCRSPAKEKNSEFGRRCLSDRIGSDQARPLHSIYTTVCGVAAEVHYTARFADGTVFDSSYKRGRPLTMRIGVGKVIKGLDQGILGGDGVPPMLVGGKRKLQIPPELAYGPEPAGCFSGDCNIPANATLVYDINFVGIYSGNRK